MQTEDNKQFRMRVAARLAALNISMRDASIKAGMAPDSLGKFLTGKNRSMRADNMAALARVLDVTESWLMGSSDDNTIEPSTFGVRFGGVVEAGAFRLQDPLDQESETVRVPLPHDWRYAPEAQFAFKVVGDSMNKANINEGMYVLALEVHAWERVHGEPTDGALVVVARTRMGAPERELTVKRLRIFRDRITLQPESTNPKHEPMTFPLPISDDMSADGYQAEIIAVCLQATWILT